MNKKKSLPPEQAAECEALNTIFQKKKSELDLNQRKISELLDISPAGVNLYLRGVNALNLNFAAQMAGLLNVPISDFSIRLAKEAAHLAEAASTSEGPELKGKVPLISWVQAGSWTEISNAYEPGSAETYYYCPVPHGPNTFALKVRGSSMENPHGRRSFYDGDIIFIDPDKCADHNSLVVVKLDESNEATFKQLIVEGSEHYLKALNPAWPIPMQKINGASTICGVVIARLEVF